MVAACTLLLALVRRHVPAEGLVPWVRESFRSVRQEHAEVAEHAEDAETTATAAVDQQPARVSDLLDMGEDGPAYHQAPDLIEMVGRRRSSR